MLQKIVLPIAIYEKLITFYRCRGLKNILRLYIKKVNCSEWVQVQMPSRQVVDFFFTIQTTDKSHKNHFLCNGITLTSFL
jgi:hypothetical protein